MTQIRFEHPAWIAENCTACGNCYTVCPDSAIPGLVNSDRRGLQHRDPAHRDRRPADAPPAPRRARRREETARRRSPRRATDVQVRALLGRGHRRHARRIQPAPTSAQAWRRSSNWFREALGDFEFAITRALLPRQGKARHGQRRAVLDHGQSVHLQGLHGVRRGLRRRRAADRHADSRSRRATAPRLELLARPADHAAGLQPHRRSRRRASARSRRCCSTRPTTAPWSAATAPAWAAARRPSIHLFTATVDGADAAAGEAAPRAARRTDRRTRAAHPPEARRRHGPDRPAAIQEAVASSAGPGPDPGAASPRVSTRSGRPNRSIRSGSRASPDCWRNSSDLQWRVHRPAPTSSGRAAMGMINSTGCTSVWGSTYPVQPLPVPVDQPPVPGLAVGGDGHVRRPHGQDGRGLQGRYACAELELAGEYEPARHDAISSPTSTGASSATTEWQLCPPVVSIGGDGAMYDIGFQNLSRVMMSGMPIKVLVVDTQVYSNTGGQACTSGFIGQVSDMAPYGSARKGKQEIAQGDRPDRHGAPHRLRDAGHRSPTSPTCIESYIDGLNSRRPALFNVYAVCQPEHGVGDDTRRAPEQAGGRGTRLSAVPLQPGQAGRRSRSASTSTAIPRSRPTGRPTSSVTSMKTATPQSMELPLTFADFAFSEGRFRKHFRTAPRETLGRQHGAVERIPRPRRGRARRPVPVPVGGRQTKPSHARAGGAGNGAGVRRAARVLAVAQVARRRRQRHRRRRHRRRGAQRDGATTRSGDSFDNRRWSCRCQRAQRRPPPARRCRPSAGAAAFEPVWIETPECTTCDECTTINPHIFAYNDEEKAVVRDPRGGPFRDIVRAAEKCTGRIIHPGTPANPNEPGLDQLIQRAAKYQ